MAAVSRDARAALVMAIRAGGSLPAQRVGGGMRRWADSATMRLALVAALASGDCRSRPGAPASAGGWSRTARGAAANMCSNRLAALAANVTPWLKD
jgi:hypothetical protein